MTVDWTRWMHLTAQEQEALVRRYRSIVKDESDAARASNYRRMDDAIRRVRT